jgi:hypothetical protein
MIIAMIAVRMVEVAADEIIGVIAVRNCLMSAARAMGVVLFVFPTAVRWGARRGIGRVDADAVLIDVIAVNVMQVTVMQIVAVVAVPNALMSATGLVDMLV